MSVTILLCRSSVVFTMEIEDIFLAPAANRSRQLCLLSSSPSGFSFVVDSSCGSSFAVRNRKPSVRRQYNCDFMFIGMYIAEYMMHYEIFYQFKYLLKIWFYVQERQPAAPKHDESLCWCWCLCYWLCNIDELVQERRNPGALAIKLRHPCVNPSISNLDCGNLPWTYVSLYASFTDKDYVNHN